MKKYLTVFVVLLSSKIFSQNEEFRIIAPLSTFDIKGSVLCENINQVYNLPDSLRGGYAFETEINADLENKELNISYLGTPSLLKIYRESIQTDLVSYFPEPDFSVNLESWKIITTIYLEKNLIDSDTLLFNPYNDCFKVNYNCDSITVDLYSIENQIECNQEYDDNLLSLVSNSENMILVQKMYLVIPANCFIGSKYIHKSSLSIKNLTNSVYSIYEQQQTSLIHCIDDLCALIPIYNNSKIGEADLSECVVNSIFAEDKASFSIYPNPSSGLIYIESYSGYIQITNSFGETQEIYGNEVFNLENLISGVYFIRFQLNNEIKIEKIILK